MFHLEGATPEVCAPPAEQLPIIDDDIDRAWAGLDDGAEVDFVSVGCPHLSLDELRRVTRLLEGGRVVMETWIHLARPLKQIADQLGYTRIIESAGAHLACDTCMVVAPIAGRFHGIATSSAKCIYYARAKHGLPARLLPLEECLRLARGEVPG
jgi:hypothetical protein